MATNYLSEHELAPPFPDPEPDVRVGVGCEDEQVDGVHPVRGVGLLGSGAHDEKRADQLQGVDGSLEVEHDRVETFQRITLERVVEEEKVVNDVTWRDEHWFVLRNLHGPPTEQNSYRSLGLK